MSSPADLQTQLKEASKIGDLATLTTLLSGLGSKSLGIIDSSDIEGVSCFTSKFSRFLLIKTTNFKKIKNIRDDGFFNQIDSSLLGLQKWS